MKFCAAVAEEMSKMSQPIRALGGHICWPIGTKNTNLVEDLEYLLPVKFREILCSGCRGDVENVKVYDGRRTDGRRTDGRRTDGHRTVRYDNSSLELRSGELKKESKLLFVYILSTAVLTNATNCHLLVFNCLLKSVKVNILQVCILRRPFPGA